MSSSVKFKSQHAEEIIELWRSENSPDAKYFEAAEAEDWTNGFWAEDSIFQRYMSHLDFTSTVEIAAGQGRHSLRLVEKCKKLYLVDTSVVAVTAARERFAPHSHVEVLLSEDGQSLPGIEDGSLTSAFSFDAMVHFEAVTIAAYLQEVARVLRPGGRAVLHFSNFSGNPAGKITDVKGWRNYMSEDLFLHFVSRSGLRIIERTTLDWSFEKSDAIALLEK